MTENQRRPQGTTLADLFETDDRIDALIEVVNGNRAVHCEEPFNAADTAELEKAIGCPLGGAAR
jgi:hypothetical protein